MGNFIDLTIAEQKLYLKDLLQPFCNNETVQQFYEVQLTKTSTLSKWVLISIYDEIMKQAKENKSKAVDAIAASIKSSHQQKEETKIKEQQDQEEADWILAKLS